MERVFKILGAVFAALGAVFLTVGIGLYCAMRTAMPALAFAPIGFAFFVFGVTFLACAGMRRRRLRRLREAGERVDAQLVEVGRSWSMSVNGLYPWVVRCQAEDPLTGRVYLFQSDAVWYDPSPYLAGLVSLPVYVQPGNWRRYAVDLAAVLPPDGLR
ncbi:MAG TPA: hypothetical protein H9883_00455 [Candidatus Ruthenibacterium merdigallinarum]|nr:hypothetical protein [Candidatus Ruthenibacterium merdigallinarum]